LWINFGSLIETLLAMSVIPMAVIGGIIGLFLTGTPFSVSAAIGFIALFGISVMNGIIVLSQHNLLIRGGMQRMQAILQTGALHIRPVLMTCVIAGVGLLPAALSTGIGSQVQKPLAIVVVSGMTLAPILILIVLPACFSHADFPDLSVPKLKQDRPTKRPIENYKAIFYLLVAPSA
jgi:cobalt-zinc-cadmium resistance protein CzcA